MSYILVKKCFILLETCSLWTPDPTKITVFTQCVMELPPKLIELFLTLAKCKGFVFVTKYVLTLNEEV